MLTRLRVKGFKSLVDVDVRFGAFTCIAGANGAGKSNLFDAICFLSALADKSLLESAQAVRDETDVRSLFHRSGAYSAQQMVFEAEMVVPAYVVDDFGREASVGRTYLSYSLILAYRDDPQKPLEITEERLRYLNKSEVRKDLAFAKPTWHTTAIQSSGGDRLPPIETNPDGSITQRGTGRPRIERRRLERTILSNSNSIETAAALAVRREMQSWRLLQLEPSALRQSDRFNAPDYLGANGEHLAATLWRLARADENVYARVANHLSKLLDDVRNLSVDQDEIRQLLTVQVTGQDGTTHPARALSDGTLRFLALAVLSEDPQTLGVLCLEEPENGIHPSRIPFIINLLESIAVDTEEPVDKSNPLRQVIVNTHSPLVVQTVPDDSLLFTSWQETIHHNQRVKQTIFKPLPHTWRHQQAPNQPTIAKGELIAYLSAIMPNEDFNLPIAPPETVKRRVADREEVRQLKLELGI
ncbi:MAG: ATPase [Chloroflexi bacterium CFX4]|nr:ATPase [Chloroflexi bacterium CFX4]MDL1921234.1 ATPase [Chloroflexi bacterium CFX3]